MLKTFLILTNLFLKVYVLNRENVFIEVYNGGIFVHLRM